MAQGMDAIYDGNHHEVGLDDLCYIIYQGFGQSGVIDFIRSRQENVTLMDVGWALCEPCEIDSPIYEGACLVCGTTN